MLKLSILTLTLLSTIPVSAMRIKSLIKRSFSLSKPFCFPSKSIDATIKILSDDSCGQKKLSSKEVAVLLLPYNVCDHNLLNDWDEDNLRPYFPCRRPGEHIEGVQSLDEWKAHNSLNGCKEEELSIEVEKTVKQLDALLAVVKAVRPEGAHWTVEWCPREYKGNSQAANRYHVQVMQEKLEEVKKNMNSLLEQGYKNRDAEDDYAVFDFSRYPDVSYSARERSVRILRSVRGEEYHD